MLFSSQSIVTLGGLLLLLVSNLASCSPIPGGRSSKHERLSPEESRAVGLARNSDEIAVRAGQVIHTAAQSHLDTLIAANAMVKYGFRPHSEVVSIGYDNDPPHRSLLGLGKKISKEKSKDYTNAYRSAKAKHLEALQQEKDQLETNIAILREGSQNTDADRLQRILNHCNKVDAAIRAPPDVEFQSSVVNNFRLTKQEQKTIQKHLYSEQNEMLAIQNDRIYHSRAADGSRASTSRQER